MRKFKRIATGLFLLLVFLAGISFSFLNDTPVPLSLGLWSFAPRPVALWIIMAFAIGGLLGLLFGTGISHYFRSQREIRELRKRLRAAETEAGKLRNMPLQDRQ
ncbi:MAG: hypothetical protein RLZZ385_768 [Pseudomonadota bacterium]|jgi:uncharacterized integral membrane protein